MRLLVKGIEIVGAHESDIGGSCREGMNVGRSC